MLPVAPQRRRTVRRAHRVAWRIRADPGGQPRRDSREPARDGAGHDDLPADADRRGARRGVESSASRMGARAGAVHRSWVLWGRVELVGERDVFADAQTRRRVAGVVHRGGCAKMGDIDGRLPDREWLGAVWRPRGYIRAARADPGECGFESRAAIA